MHRALPYQAGDVRVESVTDATIVESTDALIRDTRACTAAAISTCTSC